jgi:hypothetical protein
MAEWCRNLPLGRTARLLALEERLSVLQKMLLEPLRHGLFLPEILPADSCGLRQAIRSAALISVKSLAISTGSLFSFNRPSCSGSLIYPRCPLS